MNKKTVGSKDAADKLVKNIRRKTARRYSAEEKIRIVLAGLRGEESFAALCRREGIAESLYYKWSKEFLEAGKRQLSGDTARQATAPEVKELRQEASALKADCWMKMYSMWSPLRAVTLLSNKYNYTIKWVKNQCFWSI